MTRDKSKIFGHVQKSVLEYLIQNDGTAYVGIGVVTPQLGGLTIEQVESAVDRLMSRRVIKRIRPGFYELTNKEMGI